jgi:hypothetical protein
MRDEELLAELRALLAELDPVDPRLMQQARTAYGWRTIDAELADLSYDSFADREVLAAVRDGGLPGTGPRLLGFGTDVAGDEEDVLTVEIEVTAGAGRGSLVGQLMPPCPALVHVERFEGPTGTDPVPADDLGRFRIDPVPLGPVRLRIDTGDRVIETSWVSYATAC